MKKGKEIETCLNCKRKHSLNYEDSEMDFDGEKMQLRIIRRYTCLYEDCDGFLSTQTLVYKVGECVIDEKELED